MNEFNFKKALLTVGLSVFLSVLGLGIMKAFSSTGPTWLMFTSPFMFGISIPLSNWTELGILKLLKTLIAGLLSVGLLYVAILFSATEFNMYLISGLNGLILLWVHSQFIETIRPSFIHYIIVLVACFTAMGLSLNSVDLNGVPDFEFTILLWTSFFTVGLATSLTSKNTAASKKL